jgi:hypothetical protein
MTPKILHGGEIAPEPTKIQSARDGTGRAASGPKDQKFLRRFFPKSGPLLT